VISISNEMRLVSVSNGRSGILLVSVRHGTGIVEFLLSFDGGDGVWRSREGVVDEFALSEEVEGELSFGGDVGEDGAGRGNECEGRKR